MITRSKGVSLAQGWTAFAIPEMPSSRQTRSRELSYFENFFTSGIQLASTRRASDSQGQISLKPSAPPSSEDRQTAILLRTDFTPSNQRATRASQQRQNACRHRLALLLSRFRPPQSPAIPQPWRLIPRTVTITKGEASPLTTQRFDPVTANAGSYTCNRSHDSGSRSPSLYPLKGP